jgi:diguanylate cyclase
LLNETAEENAMTLAETLRADVEKLSVNFAGVAIRFTASFGVASAIPDHHITPQDILAAADNALYRAKHDGRNCVRSATPAPSDQPVALSA